MSDEYILKASSVPNMQLLAKRLEGLRLVRIRLAPEGFSLSVSGTSSADRARWGSTIELWVVDRTIRLQVNGYSPRQILPLILEELSDQKIAAELIEP